MDRSFKIRLFVLLGLWLPIAILCGRYAIKKYDTSRFEFLISANGTVSSLQREDWLPPASTIKIRDLILRVNGAPFDLAKVKDWLAHEPRDQRVELKVRRGGQEFVVATFLKRFSKNDLLILFFIPLILSIVFLSFSLGIVYSRDLLSKKREAVEVFSLICFLISVFFLVLLPATTLGTSFSFSTLLPFLSVMVMHLFFVYPKDKCSRRVRISILSISYALVAAFGVLRAFVHFRVGSTGDFLLQNLGFPISGLCLLSALGLVGNTLLTSRDFWARRRARLLGIVLLSGFVTAMSMFWAVLWEVPRFSVERILACSLIFPTAFAVIFLKENVFNLERMFRRGIHQLLLLGMAVTFALLLGLGWSEWAFAPGREWMLWVLIAIVVLAVARPAGFIFENKIHQWIKTKVRYPDVNDLFENASSLAGFLSDLSKHFESHLNMRNISYTFFQDPTQAWKTSNQQVWCFRNQELVRDYSSENSALYSSPMLRGSTSIGEMTFDGGDSLAFDPYSSPDWMQISREVARGIEILCLREFISIQQSFLAVGRMQALLAHQMKNPLAIIKVCAGLLNSHMGDNEEAEELLKTIQSEVGRVSEAIQSVFDHSSRPEGKQKVHLGGLLNQVKMGTLSRFKDREIEVSYWANQIRDDDISLSGIWIDKEGLRQTLNNLVVNAFEAGSSWVGIEVHLSNKDFSILIKDRGPGLHEKIDLFKPFVTTKSSGTGLGLAHVKAFMDRSAGQIKVKSKRGEGATFILDFPKQFVLNDSI